MSILISVVLVLCGLCLGTLRGYHKERAEVTGLLEDKSGLASVFLYRGADGLNLCAVADRHISGAPELETLRSVSTALLTPGGTVEEKLQLSQQLDTCTTDVITLLEGTESYSASQRDVGYVGMLKSDMESLAGQSFYPEFSSAAAEFNQKLESSLMGRFASLLGVKPCTLYYVLPKTAENERLPDNRGVLTDDANVLDARTVKDIEKFADMVEDETDVNIHVALVHFTDGMDVKKYGETLFRKWELSDEDMLIVGVIGQDGFTMVLGDHLEQKLSSSSVDNLLYTSTNFSNLFSARQYDAAFASLFSGMTDLLNKEYRENMRLGRLFDHVLDLSASNQSVFGSNSWSQTLGEIIDLDEDFRDYQEEGNGLGVVHWILLIGLVLIIINGSDPVRKAKRRLRR